MCYNFFCFPSNSVSLSLEAVIQSGAGYQPISIDGVQTLFLPTLYEEHFHFLVVFGAVTLVLCVPSPFLQIKVMLKAVKHTASRALNVPSFLSV